MAKTERIDLRLDESDGEVIRTAAAAQGVTVTSFVVSSARAAAADALADRREFLLDDTAWKAFNELLRRPPVYKPELAKLLNEPDPLV